MNSSDPSEMLWVVALVLVVFAGIFAAIDSALSTVSLARLDEMVKEDRFGSSRLRAVTEQRPRYVNLMVFLHLASLLGASTLVTLYFSSSFENSGWIFVAAIIGMTVVAYVVAGVGPRTLGRHHAYTLSLATAWPVFALGFVLGPIVRLLIFLGNSITPGKGFSNGPFASEIELRELVDMAQERGVVADDERRMIQSVFDLGDTTAREIMTPRPEMVWIESCKTVGQALRLCVRSGHSRIPVVGENVDDIVGIVYLRDLVAKSEALGAEVSPSTVAELAHPAIFIPDSKPLDSLLSEMQRDRNHMAILVDEYGGIAGLVSIEDVLEEIVGEIADEHDAGEVVPIEDLGGGAYRFSARVSLDEFSETTGTVFDDEVTEEIDTIGGLLALELGRIPLPKAVVTHGGYRFVAEGGPDDKGRVRVSTVHVTPLSDVDDASDSDTSTKEKEVS